MRKTDGFQLICLADQSKHRRFAHWWPLANMSRAVAGCLLPLLPSLCLQVVFVIVSKTCIVVVGYQLVLIAFKYLGFVSSLQRSFQLLSALTPKTIESSNATPLNFFFNKKNLFFFSIYVYFSIEIYIYILRNLAVFDGIVAVFFSAISYDFEKRLKCIS